MAHIAQTNTVESRKSRAVKRYNLSIPEEIFNEVQRIADEDGSSTVDVLRRFIKLGLIASQEGNTIILSNARGDRELVLL